MAKVAVWLGLLILGLGFLAGAGYVWTENDLAHYGQSTYAITGMEEGDIEPESTQPANSSVVAYSDLPPKAQAAFDKARNGEGNLLWSRDDRRAVEALWPYSGEYVEYQGEYYRILVLSGHRGDRYWRRALLKFIGAGAIGAALVGISVRNLHETRLPD